MVTVSALDHIVLVVIDIEAALDWHQRHVGLGPVNVRGPDGLLIEFRSYPVA